jgi:hypothetical protein
MIHKTHIKTTFEVRHLSPPSDINPLLCLSYASCSHKHLCRGLKQLIPASNNKDNSKMKFGIWWLVPIVALMGKLQQSSSYIVSSNHKTRNNNHNSKHETTLENSRRSFIQHAPAFLFGLATTLTLPSSPAMAKDEPIELRSKEEVTAAFQPIKFELQDPKGGVAFMQQKIDQQDWAGLMDFTKGYDLELRKKTMGTAKKLLQSKDIQLLGTEYSNAVTFDLIGMNRNSRAGQESVEGANKYLQELRDDVAKFLTLEETIQLK